MVTVRRILRIVRRVIGFPGRVWERRNHRWGDYIERAALAIAIVFIIVAFGQIQDSRRDTIVRSCVETNERHDNALRVVDERIAQAIRKDPARASELRQSREFTVLLLDAIVPHTDCTARAERLTE